MPDLREVAIISGKGGTGKTSICGALAVLAEELVIADCDVDAANLGLILRPSLRETHDFTASRTAIIDAQECSGCGRCAEVCRFGAVIQAADGTADVEPLACEGCGVCAHICPVGAIRLEESLSGRWFVSDTPHGTLVHARLGPGEENSGKLVTTVRNRAREIAQADGKGLVLIDGPPGIGCPVIASLSGVTCALVVTEPTVPAIHDMDRVLAVCRHFDVPTLVVVNRSDLDEGNRRAIAARCAREGLEVAAEIPYDPVFTRAMVEGRTVVEHSDGEVPRLLGSLWERLRGRLGLRARLECGGRPGLRGRPEEGRPGGF